ncbi:MAG: isocitrate lyase/PEP mutase family protein [Proteobacteria bacterium]|nr:isocitrate lyase/PEP mutase family protein [Pseudomonadota bacterium]
MFSGNSAAAPAGRRCAGKRQAARLRTLLAGQDVIVAPGAFDALSARLVERAGFKAAYMTGFGVSAARAGLPDLGLLTATEFADQVAQMTRNLGIPLIADADHGFGNSLQIERTMQLYEQAGASAIQLEDQDADRRCGHLDGKRIVPVAEMVARIRVMKAAQGDSDTVLIARTDARAVEGMDAALQRGAAYLRAGADALFVEAPRSVEELARIGREFQGEVLLANMPEGGKTPYLPFHELGGMGFRIVIYPVVTLFPATRGTN